MFLDVQLMIESGLRRKHTETKNSEEFGPWIEQDRTENEGRHFVE